MSFEIRDDHLILIETGQAVSRRWTKWTKRKPQDVTWHWTATQDLSLCRKFLDDWKF